MRLSACQLNELLEDDDHDFENELNRATVSRKEIKAKSIKYRGQDEGYYFRDHSRQG